MTTGRPVLLVHGAWHGPWCWNEWVHELADRGHRPMTVTLPGHDSPGSDHRIWHRLGEYIDEVVAQLTFLGPDAVVVGHSMGGLVTQRALERAPAALGILMAPVPLSGVLGATVRTARRAPLAFARTNALVSMYELVDGAPLTRDAFFTEETAEADVVQCTQSIQNESYVAYLQMFVVRGRPRRVTTPIEVIAGDQDALFTVSEQETLAKRYRTRAHVIRGAGHDLMLGPWSGEALEHVAGLIDDLPDTAP